MYYVCYYDVIEKRWKAYFTFGEYEKIEDAKTYAQDHSYNTEKFIGVCWGRSFDDLDNEPETIYLAGNKWDKSYR
jgi:hypothetical protein